MSRHFRAEFSLETLHENVAKRHSYYLSLDPSHLLNLDIKIMTQPAIAAKQPTVLELQAGDYWWCTCGQSANQPFCNGSHQGSSFVPQKFTVAEQKTVALCQCKQTGNPPFCDGKHAQL